MSVFFSEIRESSGEVCGHLQYKDGTCDILPGGWLENGLDWYDQGVFVHQTGSSPNANARIKYLKVCNEGTSDCFGDGKFRPKGDNGSGCDDSCVRIPGDNPKFIYEEYEYNANLQASDWHRWTAKRYDIDTFPMKPWITNQPDAWHRVKKCAGHC